MAMTFNEFQRELNKRNIDGHLAIVLTEMFAQQREVAEQLDQAVKIITALTETVANFAQLHEATTGRLRDLTQRVNGEHSGIEVNSVAYRDEPGDN